MRAIDLENWPRRQSFDMFSAYDHPHVGLCANVDLTAFRPAVKERGYSLTVSIVYVVTRASNAIPAFRQHIRGHTVVEHEVVHPGFAILVSEDQFSFCVTDYVEDFPEFASGAAERIAAVRADPWVHLMPRDDVLYMTALPWVSFTSIPHPMHLQTPDSVPRFAWGKFFAEGDRLKMPLAVQGHHGLIDGLQIGQYYEKFQELLDRPDAALSGA